MSLKHESDRSSGARRKHSGYRCDAYTEGREELSGLLVVINLFLLTVIADMGGLNLFQRR